jgi:FkbM family methyltransferase
MTFISYAQNYEDVMLRRALKDVDKGFYIDVGANDPVADSVTKAFYDVGWRGINIEPVSEWIEKLQQERPDDINLQLAVGARKGKVNFYEVVGTGLSTMDESLAKRHARERGYELKKYKVPVVRLTTICEQQPLTDIHFLKIDVEGAELKVLQGLDLKKIRPWIILVESTLPNTQVENREEWEYSLTGRGYHHVYFDGLNRFYVADGHDELDAAFLAPPNCFDLFKSADEDWLVRQYDERLREKEESINWLNSEWERLNTQLQAVYKSSSWRITWPLRKLMQLFRWMAALPYRVAIFLIGLPKRLIRRFLIKAMVFTLKRPALKFRATAWLRKYPRLDIRLRRLAQARGLIAVQPGTPPIPDDCNLELVETEPAAEKETSPCGADLSHMSPSAHRIYRELKAAIEKRQTESS